MRQRNRPLIQWGGFYIDISYLAVVFCIALFGLVMVYSASYYTAQLKYGSGMYFFRRQAAFLFLGSIAMFIAALIPYRFYTRLWLGVWVLSSVLLLYTGLRGKSVNGKRRWMRVTGSISFQPSELAKLAIILMMAVMISRFYEVIDRRNAILLLLALVGIPVALIGWQDWSTAIITFGIAFSMYFIGCRENKKFIPLFLLGGAAVPVIINYANSQVQKGVTTNFHLGRIVAWQNPAAYASGWGYQILQGLYAIGSGGIFGKGLCNSVQKLNFLPESQNDMIFSIVCEELGVVGAVVVITLYGILLYKMLFIAVNAPDMLGSMVVIGVMAQIAIQTILNIGVVTNLIPNTGVSLPLISYGGTSTLFLMAELGMVLGVSMRIRPEE